MKTSQAEQAAARQKLNNGQLSDLSTVNEALIMTEVLTEKWKGDRETLWAHLAFMLISAGLLHFKNVNTLKETLKNGLILADTLTNGSNDVQRLAHAFIASMKTSGGIKLALNTAHTASEMLNSAHATA